MRQISITFMINLIVINLLWGQSFNTYQYQPSVKDYRIERDYSGNLIVYEGYTMVQSIEKNYYGGYDVYSYESGSRDKIRSVERSVGDVYDVYSYEGASKQKVSTIRGVDEYLNALYGQSEKGGSHSPVQVYEVKGDFISDLGKTVLPAPVQPLDFSALDSYMDTSTKLMEKDLERVKQIAAYLESGKATESEKKILIDELKRIKKFWDEH